MSKIWWKESIMYQIYPRSFKDSNGDGIGDIRGIIEKVDYIAGLGVDLIWLGPVFQSPNDDNGYDISDYYEIHPEFGTMDDFKELLDILHNKGIKLIMDLVVNHSSDEHEWFKEAKKSKDNPYRDYYIWKEGKNGGPPNNWEAFFGGDAWQLDENTGEYYHHLFSVKQPDLNWENPKLRAEIYKMMKFWLDMGVDGFRMDVISLISKRLEYEDTPVKSLMYQVNNYNANGPRIHEYLQEMHQEVLSKYDIVTVGEGPGITKDLANLYIGQDRNELNMLFQLELMFMDHGPDGKFDIQETNLIDFKRLFREWNDAIAEEGWNNIFLDNHDFPRMLSRYGNDQKHRFESATLLATFLLTMRGTPCIYMGSEIGMGNVAFDTIEDYRDLETLNYYNKAISEGAKLKDVMRNIHIQGRDNVRTPMQWNDKNHAGFTTGTPWIKVNPEYIDVNARLDRESENSIYIYYQNLIKLRKSAKALIYGDFVDLLPDDPSLYFYTRSYNGKTYYIILNFSDNTVVLPQILKDKELIFSNYQETYDLTLDPWDARIYTA